jgi:hypothetical protein
MAGEIDAARSVPSGIQAFALVAKSDGHFFIRPKTITPRTWHSNSFGSQLSFAGYLSSGAQCGTRQIMRAIRSREWFYHGKTMLFTTVRADSLRISQWRASRW